MSERQFEILNADDIRVKGSEISQDILSEKCILCGMQAHILIYVYDPPRPERLFGLVKSKDRELVKAELVCDQDCADMVVLRNL